MWRWLSAIRPPALYAKNASVSIKLLGGPLVLVHMQVPLGMQKCRGRNNTTSMARRRATLDDAALLLFISSVLLFNRP